MNRQITFDEKTGDVLVGTDRIMCGVVLLAPEQARESLRHGWRESKGTHNEREMGLVRIHRSMTTTPTVIIDGVTLTPEQATLLRAAVQTMLQFVEKASDSPLKSAAQLREINELLSVGR